MGDVKAGDFGHAQDARVALQALMAERGWTKAEVARRIGVSGTVVSQWLRDVYHRGDNERVRMLVQRLLDTERDAAALVTRGLNRHADLAVTGEIAAVIAHAHANADMVVVYGAAGASKTWTAKRYCEEHAGCTMATMSPATTTPSAVLAKVAKRLDGAAAGTSAARLERAVVDRLSVGRTLLVVDEAHHLNQMLLDVVRCVHDAAGCGLALLGNTPLWGRLADGDRTEQLVSRVGIRLELTDTTEADVLALGQTLLGRAAAGAGRRALLAAGAGKGGLRAVRKLLAQALVLARGDDREKASDQDLADAAELLGS